MRNRAPGRQVCRLRGEASAPVPVVQCDRHRDEHGVHATAPVQATHQNLVQPGLRGKCASLAEDNIVNQKVAILMLEKLAAAWMRSANGRGA